MQIGAICHRELAVVGRHEPVADAVRLMGRCGISELIVVEDPHVRSVPVGILREEDIVWYTLGGGTLDHLQVQELMVRPRAIAFEREDVDRALESMRRTRQRCLLVVDDEGRLQGTLALEYLVEMMGQESRELASVGN